MTAILLVERAAEIGLLIRRFKVRFCGDPTPKVLVISQIEFPRLRGIVRAADANRSQRCLLRVARQCVHQRA